MQRTNSSRQLFPILIIALGGLLLFGAAGWLIYDSQQSKTTAPPESSAGEIPYPEIDRVGLGDAKAALDIKHAIFLDVRSEEAYNLSHISGALSLPEDQLSERIGELDPQAWIIPYCT